MTPPTRRRAGFLCRWLGHVAEDQPGPDEHVHRAGVVRVGRLGRSPWVLMYFSTAAADTVPADAAKYDDDHKVGIRDFRCGNSSRSTREVKPLNWLATYEAEDFGSCLTKRWTRSGVTSRVVISQPRSSAFCRISSSRRSATRPSRTGRRYFGHHTTWSPRSCTPPENRRTFLTTAIRSLYMCRGSSAAEGCAQMNSTDPCTQLRPEQPREAISHPAEAGRPLARD